MRRNVCGRIREIPVFVSLQMFRYINERAFNARAGSKTIPLWGLTPTGEAGFVYIHNNESSFREKPCVCPAEVTSRAESHWFRADASRVQVQGHKVAENSQ